MKPLPTVHRDGTLDAIVAAPTQDRPASALLSVLAPAGLADEPLAGRYFLVRCGAQTPEERAEQWHIYARRALFIANRELQQAPAEGVRGDLYRLVVPKDADPGYAWLRRLPVGASVNLIGPLGAGFVVAPASRNLLLLADVARLPTLLSLPDAILDRGGRVTMILLHQLDATSEPPTDRSQMAWLDRLPLAVEVHLVTTAQEWLHQVEQTALWADQVCAAVPGALLPSLASAIRSRRYRLEPGFASVLVEADLVCGVGACLACVVPVGDGGLTRACIHGPVMDLARFERPR